MREYSVLLPLGRLEVGVPIDRSAWPLHVTIQSNVRTDADPRVVVDAVRDAAASLGPIRGVVTGEARFGPDRSVLVDLVDSDDARRGHDLVHAILQDRVGAVSITPAADGDGYRPHVTVTSRGRARRGDRLELRTVVLVEIRPGGDRRVALPLAVFDLLGG